ncbi:MAG: YifB family Mg chelatase-like AAA ATPase [Elusimicrobia bacterium]|nr:YifB family Mg chelatase-like AAA ATPase [Elusimicrobiota bacterium]
MLSRVHSVGVRGVEGYPVLVELDLANGLPGYTTVGLPDSAVRESRERVVAAVRNSGFKMPPRRITVNLAPAQARKEGTQFDLPIALAVLTASGQLPGQDWPGRYCFVGELALDGALRPVRGVLAMALEAKARGFEAIVVPAENADEARAIGLKTFSGSSLREVADFLSGARPGLDAGRPAPACVSDAYGVDFNDVKGQALAKRALEIAAAGGHNVLLIGPPGVGKSMLARRLVTILPPLTHGESVEVTRVHSVGSGRWTGGLVLRRPFRAPHHTASTVSLIGGGPAGRPGEASLAHGGVLFLDELAEFGRQALEALRQPLEDFKAVVARARESVEYPARFQLVAATNPCPCGWRGHAQRGCVCTPPAVQNYLGRLSGPLLDRIDLQVEMSALGFGQWAGDSQAAESSAQILERVLAARRVQSVRLGRPDFALNAYVGPRDIRAQCELDAEGLELLETAATRFSLSARSLDRLLRVSRTIADLGGSPGVRAHHLSEAVQYRSLDRSRAQA